MGINLPVKYILGWRVYMEVLTGFTDSPVPPSFKRKEKNCLYKMLVKSNCEEAILLKRGRL